MINAATMRRFPGLVMAMWLGCSIARADMGGIQDSSAFFSPAAKTEAMRTIGEIERRFKKGLVIETFNELPADLKQGVDLQDKAAVTRVVSQWTRQLCIQKRVNGIFVLILKNPGKLFVEVGDQTQLKAFTLQDRDALVSTMVAEMRLKQYDGALLAGASFVLATLSSHLDTPIGRVNVPGAAPAGTQLVPRTDAPELNVEHVANAKTPLVFQVHVTWEEDAQVPPASTTKGKYGSGVRVRCEPGFVYVVSNRHVVEVPKEARNISRTILIAGKYVPFQIIGYGKNKVDLAMLKVPVAECREKTVLPYVFTNQLAVGQDCVAIGNSLGKGISVTTGIISRFDDMGNYKAVRTSAPISPGNSGGGLFRRKDGRLIGITSSNQRQAGVQNISYAIPSNYIFGANVWEAPTVITP